MKLAVVPALVLLTICGVVFIELWLVPPSKIPGHTTNWVPWTPPTNLVPWNLMPSYNNNTAARIAYIIMTSLVTRDLHLWQRRTWLRGARHVWAFSDFDNDIFTTTLPSLVGKGTWHDAQHRQLRGMQWLRLPAEVEWIFMVDDDTWVNVPVLYRFLEWLPANSTMLCGHRANNGMFNGGGGILISRRLYEIMVPRLYSEQCPFLGVNDDTVTECARKTTNATLMHSSAFSFYPDTIYSSNNFVGQITIHPVKNFDLMQAMTATVNEFYAD